MDEPEFTVVRLRAEEEALELPSFWRKFRGKTAQKIKYRWLMWRLPLACGELICLNQCGEEIWLPFTREDLAAYSNEELTDMLHRIIIEKGAQNMVVDKLLEPYLEKGLRIDGRLMPLLMLKEIVSFVCRKHQISWRELRPVVIAGEAEATRWTLNCLGDQLNRLTIVTKEPGAYESFARYSYEENGLLVSIRPRPVTADLYGNLVIELDPCREKDYLYYRSGSIVLNLSGNRYRTLDACIRRKDLICYNRFDIRADGVLWDNRILQAVIYKTATAFGAGQLGKGSKIKDLYGFAVEKTGLES